MTNAKDANIPSSEAHAQEQLEVLQATGERSSTVQGTAHKQFAGFATALALLIGAAHTIPVIFNPAESLTIFFIAMGVYVVAIMVLTTWYLRARSATPVGGNKRYLYGLAGTFILYAASIFLWPHETWMTSILVGLVIALPLTVAAWWKSS